MKKRLTIMLAMITALACACASAAASIDDFYDHMTRIKDGTVAYTITTVETGAMAPVEGYNPEFADILLEATLKPAAPEDVPEGEYVVLDLPEEHVRYDFFVGEAEKNLFRQVNADGSDTWPTDVEVTVQLTADGEAVEGKTATLSEDEPSYTFESLPKYQANGTTEIEYSVDEVEVAGYTSVVGDLEDLCQ